VAVCIETVWFLLAARHRRQQPSAAGGEDQQPLHEMDVENRHERNFFLELESNQVKDRISIQEPKFGADIYRNRRRQQSCRAVKVGLPVMVFLEFMDHGNQLDRFLAKSCERR
jgi:hypothetical protein